VLDTGATGRSSPHWLRRLGPNMANSSNWSGSAIARYMATTSRLMIFRDVPAGRRNDWMGGRRKTVQASLWSFDEIRPANGGHAEISFATLPLGWSLGCPKIICRRGAQLSITPPNFVEAHQRVHRLETQEPVGCRRGRAVLQQVLLDALHCRSCCEKGVTSRFAQNRTLCGSGKEIRVFHKRSIAKGRRPAR